MDILTYMAKGTLQMTLRILKLGDHSRWSTWAQCNRKGPYKEVGENVRRGARDVTMETEVAVTCFEDGQRGRDL